MAGSENILKNSINPVPVKNMIHKNIVITFVILAPIEPNAQTRGAPINAPNKPEFLLREPDLN